MRCGLRMKGIANIVVVYNYTATLFLPYHQNSLSHSNSLLTTYFSFFFPNIAQSSHIISILAQKEILEVISSLSPFFSMKNLSPHRLAQYHRYQQLNGNNPSLPLREKTFQIGMSQKLSNLTKIISTQCTAIDIKMHF